MSSFCGTGSATTMIFALNKVSNQASDPRSLRAHRQNSRSSAGTRTKGDRRGAKKVRRKKEKKKRRKRRFVIVYIRRVLSILLASSSVPSPSPLLLAFHRADPSHFSPFYARHGADGTLLNIVEASVSHLSSRLKLRADDLRFPPFRRQSINSSLIIGRGGGSNSKRKQNSVTFSKLHRYATGKLIYFFARSRGGNEAVLSAGQNTSLSVSTRLRFIWDPVYPRSRVFRRTRG